MPERIVANLERDPARAQPQNFNGDRNGAEGKALTVRSALLHHPATLHVLCH